MIIRVEGKWRMTGLLNTGCHEPPICQNAGSVTCSQASTQKLGMPVQYPVSEAFLCGFTHYMGGRACQARIMPGA